MKTIERMILLALIRDMRAQGYEVASVWDGDNYQMPGPDATIQEFPADSKFIEGGIVRPMTDEEACEAMDSVCESTLHFTYRNKKTWGTRGVLVILGNGEDVLSDFHAPPTREPFQKVVIDIYDKLEKGLVL